jgi:hypothetical protein
VRQFDQVKVMMKAMAGGGGLPSLPHGMRPPGAGPGPGRGKPKQRPHRPKQHAKGKKRKRK